MNLVKTDCDTEWPKLIEGEEEIRAARNDPETEQQRDTSAMASVAFQSGLEDCDYETDGTDNEYYIGESINYKFVDAMKTFNH